MSSNRDYEEWLRHNSGRVRYERHKGHHPDYPRRNSNSSSESDKSREKKPDPTCESCRPHPGWKKIWVENKIKVVCSTCRGQGKMMRLDYGEKVRCCTRKSGDKPSRRCTYCRGGKGYYMRYPRCDACHGTGQTETITRGREWEPCGCEC